VPRPDFRKRYYDDEKNQYERKIVNFLKEKGPNQN
jgi:hypothetical protein